MKKILVIALAVLVLVGAVSVLAACDSGKTYTGYCFYASPYGAGGYGCVVDVTVKGDTIVAIKLYSDKEAAEWAMKNNIKVEKEVDNNWDGVPDETVEVKWELVDGESNAHRTTPTWISEKAFEAMTVGDPAQAAALEAGYQKPHTGDIGYAHAEASYQAWFEEYFIGKTVAEVNLYVAYATISGQAVADDGTPKIAGATQSSARIIVAIQNALAQIDAK